MPDGRTFKPSIWRIPAEPGQTGRPARARLTRSAEGEDNPAFLPDGSLVFLSARPAPPDGPPDGPAGEPGSAPPGQPGSAAARRCPGRRPTAGKRALWLLPADGGEACQLTAPPGGICRLATAAGRAAGRVHLPGAARRQRHRRRRGSAGRAGPTPG